MPVALVMSSKKGSHICFMAPAFSVAIMPKLSSLMSLAVATVAAVSAMAVNIVLSFLIMNHPYES